MTVTFLGKSALGDELHYQFELFVAPKQLNKITEWLETNAITHLVPQEVTCSQHYDPWIWVWVFIKDKNEAVHFTLTWVNTSREE